MLLRLTYLGVTNVFALLRLPPRGDRDKDIEILTLRHQITVVQRQPDGQRIQFQPADSPLLTALLHALPRPTLRGPHPSRYFTTMRTRARFWIRV
ncbi:hypothetical protein [Pseudofrankia sp. BMG5.37]|uniref:hypothetical protein n=1 Tax=Pseudofrankia sp. BMG5.37 TaxID=3050035 RepID=UPI00091425D8|nr:hypothetical protein [Pseudofrankia sp. BMG5.37]MDT3446603.1 hypothetical protein [Pseudofrankia sp. BMG5.37]OHV62854.1 hypothetical protein BCD48_38890 [Pseudofrankia sp. BMG5.36]